MKRLLSSVIAFAIALVAHASSGFAQVDPMNAVPGGATGNSAVCIQVGELNTGAFVGLFSAVDGNKWEEKSFSRPGAFRFEEGKRAEETLDLIDTSRQLSIQFDFVRKKVRTARRVGSSDWTDLYHILNATDQEGASDCQLLASRLGRTASGAGGTGGAGGSGAGSGGIGGGGGPTTIIQNITVRPDTIIAITPGTSMSATSGPPCPGQPGFFLCPNRFSCAPVGGVCCPGVGACAPGTFCDRFVPNACIGAGNPRFCAGSGNPLTGVSLHCAPGSVCIAGPFCNP